MFACKLLAVLSLILVIVLSQAEARAQVEHGSLLGPSGRFERTKNLAAPPVDLNKPPIFLPEFIPIHEDNGENPRPAGAK